MNVNNTLSITLRLFRMGVTPTESGTLWSMKDIGGVDPDG
ncbi:MAG: Uncharacterised protein [Marine Group II euryarchaeote MED-G33]|nr:MAG: Uncharacterised protein [Marine Group II euryarchaeote MED-G33]